MHDESEQRVVDALVRAAFEVIATVTTVSSAHELSLTQGRVLGILRDRTMRMADLAAALGLERSTLSGLVDRAEARGLLQRQRSDADGRSISLTLTEHGQAIADRGSAQVRTQLSPLLERLSIEAHEQLATLLETALSPEPATA